jgi:hypothetical protein
MTDSANLQQQQHEMIKGAQERMAAWMTRRQQALETGVDALKRMAACKTPVEAAVIYSEWLSGSMTRVMADLEDFQAQTVRVADQVQKTSKSLMAEPAAQAPQQLRQAA